MNARITEEVSDFAERNIKVVDQIRPNDTMNFKSTKRMDSNAFSRSVTNQRPKSKTGERESARDSADFERAELTSGPGQHHSLEHRRMTGHSKRGSGVATIVKSPSKSSGVSHTNKQSVIYSHGGRQASKGALTLEKSTENLMDQFKLGDKQHKSQKPSAGDLGRNHVGDYKL